MRAIILSAGLGERLRPLTSVRAKPAIEFLNIPMLGFPYFWLSTLGLEDLVLNTHHLPDTIRHSAMHLVRPEVQLHFPHEPSILGSGGGIWNARFYLRGQSHFAVANGDGVILCERLDTFRQMLEFHQRHQALATILVCPLEGVGTRLPGVWLNSSGRVFGFGKEQPSPQSECLHYASFMLLSDRVLDLCPEGSSNILYDVLLSQIANGETVMGFRVNQMRWFETGNTNDYLSATRDCLDYLSKPGDPFGQCLGEALKALSPESEFTLRTDLKALIHKSARVSPSAELKGHVVVGPNCIVEGYSKVENSVLLPETKVLGGQSVISSVLI